ncbi:MAG: CocE/NonD family hydrolase C-terminal non-catalytic domain-containing protein, partial [Alphaproteobacteria bacterium]
NLTHRDSHANPSPLEPGRRYRVRVKLNDIAHAFPPGHRIRVAVTNHCFPLALTSPRPTTLTVFPAGSGLELPLRPPRAEDGRLAPFGPPVTAKGLAATEYEPAGRWRRVEHDLATGTTSVIVRRGRGRYRLHDVDLLYGSDCRHRFSVRAADPTSVRQSSAWTITLERDDWRIRIETELALAVTRENVLLAATIEAFEGDRRVFSRAWDKAIPRDLG